MDYYILLLITTVTLVEPITILTTSPDGTSKLVLQSHVTFWLSSENRLIEPGSCSVETILEWLIKSTEVWQGDNEVKPLLLLKANFTSVLLARLHSA